MAKNALSQYLNPQTGGFGQAAYDRAIAGGLTPSQIRDLLPGSGASAVGDVVKQTISQAASAPPSYSPPSSGNALTPYLNPQTGGFGQSAYDRAVAGGLTPSQINQLLPSSGATAVGDIAKATLSRAASQPAPSSSYQSQVDNLTKDYEDRLASTTKNYESQLASMRDSGGALQSQLGSLQSQLITANAARDEAKKQTETLQQQYNTEREIAIDSQLRGVRSGSTTGGTGGMVDGNVVAGRPAYQQSSESDSLLTDYKKRIISSSANSTSQVSVVPQIQRGSRGGATERSAPGVDRAALSSYYSRRFSRRGA